MKRWHILLILIVGLLASIGYMGFQAVAKTWSHDWPRESFTSERWRTTPAHERYKFAKDLQERRILDSRSRSDIVEMLGSPDFESRHGRYMTYLLKNAEPGEYTLNFVYLLHIQFDRDDRVVKYFLRSD